MLAGHTARNALSAGHISRVGREFHFCKLFHCRIKGNGTASGLARYGRCSEQGVWRCQLDDNPQPWKEIMNSSDISQASSESVGAAPRRSAIGSTAEQVRSTARDATNHLKSTAADAASRVKEQAASYAGQQKAGVADRLGGIGSAIHESARSLEQDDPNIAWLTHQVADRLESLGNYVRDRDFSQLRGDLEGVARRNPALFLSGLFVTGVVVGNLLKATQAPRYETASTADLADRYPTPPHSAGSAPFSGAPGYSPTEQPYAAQSGGAGPASDALSSSEITGPSANNI